MPDVNFTYDEMVRQAGSWLGRVQYELDTQHFIAATCDESSLLFSDESALNAFLKWAHDSGLEHFGSVQRDTMAQRYGNSYKGIENLDGPAFDVRFEFLRVPGQSWRIEAMCVLDGQAPLHEAALSRYGEGSVVHVSWRAAPNQDADGYLRHRTVMEATTEAAGGFEPLAEYQNSYGRFCYYGEPGVPPYLKPRVNLRDSREG